MEIAELDESQALALGAAVAPCRVSILGAPGTGKTHVLSALVQREVAAADIPPRIAVLTQDRRSATLLRNSISRRIGGLPETVKVQTLAAFCYALVQTYAQAVDRRDPELISGPDEDAILGEILASSPQIEFPPFVTDDVRGLASFRAEIRNLITRAAELGYSPEDLDRLAEQYSEPMWHAGAQVMQSYEHLTQARAAFAGTPDSADLLDHAQLVGTAASMLAGWDANVAAAPSGEGLPVTRPRWDWVLVDDLQNAPRSILDLLSELAADGACLVVAGDPDAAVQGFRGGVASLPGDITAPAPEGLGCAPVYLRRRHRGSAQMSELSDHLVQRIRVGGAVVGHRLPAYLENGVNEDVAPGEYPIGNGGREARAGAVSAASYVHREEEIAAIARTLRLLHFRDGTPYAQMAIVTRSRADHAALRGSLIRKAIPVEQIGSDRPLHEHPAVAGLVDVIRLSLAIGEDLPELSDVLTSCIVDIDPLELRRIGRVLRGFEVVRGGRRSESELLELVLQGPEAVREHAPTGAEQLVRAAAVFSAVRTAAEDNSWLAEEVLWAGWEACGKAEIWRRQALEGGLSGDWADVALDSVIQLFRVAQRLADRATDVTISELITEVSNQQFPEDSIARLGGSQEAVTLTTPSASQGREWDVVVIAGLQDGAWPNMRVRDTYTHTARLTQIATGRLVPGLSEREQRFQDVEETLDDELRQLYHSLGRARQRLILTCVQSDDSVPSRFFEAMGFFKEDEAENLVAGESASGQTVRVLRTPRAQHADLDMPGLIGQLRRAAATVADEEMVPATDVPSAASASSESNGKVALQLLDELKEAGVAEAQPRLWFDEVRPFVAPRDCERHVSVSPSRVESLLACPLQGFLSGVGAENADGRDAANLGTFIHSLAEALPHGSLSEYAALLDERWTAEFEDPHESLGAFQRYSRARTMVEALAAYVKDHPEEVKTEERARIEVNEMTALNASLDRVSFTPDGVKVADFKTGKLVVNQHDAEDHVQMQLYQLIVERLYSKSEGAELVFVGKPKAKGEPTVRTQRPLAEQGKERAEERIREAADILRSDAFAANADEKLCERCSFRAVCPAKSEGRMFS